jgi:DNA replication ATP-dependent helicase Dna2
MLDSATLDELFGRVARVLAAELDKTTSSVNRYLHETLVLVCNEATKGQAETFGNVFSQIDFLCRQHHIHSVDRFAIQRMRLHTNASEPIVREDLLHDLRALAVFISKVFEVQIPAAIFSLLPHDVRPMDKQSLVDTVYIRCIVNSWDDKFIYASCSDKEDVLVDYVNTLQGVDLKYVPRLLHQGMQLNLLECHVVQDVVVPRIIVVEPDFLVDISSIAACFTDYGHHPLLYTIKRMQRKQSSQPILLGNFASRALDDMINRPSFKFDDTYRDYLRARCLEFCSCRSIDWAGFKADALRQSLNIKQAVEVLFTSQYERNKAILEPSFVCECLGLQGRVDLMTTDMRLLVEQKSGKNYNIEHNIRSGTYGMQKENHYVQVLLYYGVLRYNFALKQDQVDIRLLYSKFPPDRGLLIMNYYQQLVREAMEFRNRVVAYEYFYATQGLGRVLNFLRPETVNTVPGDERFFDTYIRPELERVTAPLQSLTELERAYFLRMMSFVYREQLVQKVGGVIEQGGCNADLWNMPLHEKVDSGNIFMGLTIVKKEQRNHFNGYDRITLAIPKQGDGFLPNFRRGDMVYLYSYKAALKPDVRRSILYKGVLEDIHTDSLVVILNNGQQNPDIIDSESDVFALEHGSSDISANNAISGIHLFISSPRRFRNLLLGQRVPDRDGSLKLNLNFDVDRHLQEILLKIKQAKDYFLLVGPPGTGKTSIAMRCIVNEALTDDNASLLLMAYTNRAVDEICSMLCQSGLDFLRLGGTYSCDPRFRQYLFEERLTDFDELSDMKSYISSVRIIVGTTSMVASRSYIFNIKHFTLAVIDEASQILEPNIAGILGSHDDHSGALFIDKFILIGDYKQLPAVVQQKESESIVDDSLLLQIGITNCRISLFERLLCWERSQKRTDFVGVLNKQGRMHPDIAEFPDNHFYFSERLEPVPLEHQLEQSINYHCSSPDALDDILLHHRMVFIPSSVRRDIEISDKVNIDEAEKISEIVKRIYHYTLADIPDGGTCPSIGIIVPYRNQIAMIRRMIEKLNIPELMQISIDTVERYQGSQRDVIIYSFTVQNGYQLDFLTNNTFVEDGHLIDRKLNVAITRARKQMIMVGNEGILSLTPVFKELISFVKKKGGFFSNWNPLHKTMQKPEI